MIPFLSERPFKSHTENDHRVSLLWMLTLALLPIAGCKQQEVVEMSSAPIAQPNVHDLQVWLDELVAAQPLPTAIVAYDIRRKDLLVASELAPASFARHAQPPGSTVKPLVYAAALRADSWDEQRAISCSGKIEKEPDWSCFEVHGDVSLVRAIATSCNVYGWAVADAMGPEVVRKALERAGLTSPTGLVADEDSGELEPLVATGEERRDQNRLIALGHGKFHVTLLQLARAYAGLVTDPEFESGELKVIREGLIQTVTSGTAQQARVSGLEVMGKTGSAEPAGVAPADDSVSHNGWFVGVAPVVDPEVVVAIQVLGGESGGKTAAPLAARFLQRWAQDRQAE